VGKHRVQCTGSAVITQYAPQAVTVACVPGEGYQVPVLVNQLVPTAKLKKYRGRLGRKPNGKNMGIDGLNGGLPQSITCRGADPVALKGKETSGSRTIKRTDPQTAHQGTNSAAKLRLMTTKRRTQTKFRGQGKRESPKREEGGGGRRDPKGRARVGWGGLAVVDRGESGPTPVPSPGDHEGKGLWGQTSGQNSCAQPHRPKKIGSDNQSLEGSGAPKHFLKRHNGRNKHTGGSKE